MHCPEAHALCSALLLLIAGCQGSETPSGGTAPVTAETEPTEGEIFVDRAAATGLDFVHVNGGSGEYYYPEIMSPGGALFDFDNDGDLDVYLVQSRLLGAATSTAGDRLFRNELESTGSLRFTDVTSTLGAAMNKHGVGVAAGDFDNDGWVDLYVTNFGPNQLLRNNGGGTDGGAVFTDVTRTTGTADVRWSVAATFFDYDRDGWLDLYVGNYLDFTLGTHKLCYDAAGAQDYCGPTAYGGVPDRLFRNRGRAGPAVTFEDVSLASGVGKPRGRSLGAVAADLDGDGWLDLYVTNDGEPNFLWINQRDGRFHDEALLAGCAVNEDGRPEASMGVDAADFDNDGDDDLFMTHLTGESNTLFRNEGGGRFSDLTSESGLGVPSWQHTGFGTHWLDFDNDGWLDLLAVNGAVRTLQELAQAGDPYPFHQTRQLFRQHDGGAFEDVTARAGAAFRLSEVGRGAAFGDVDNDGDTDVLVVNNNGPARLLVNASGSSRPWIGLETVGESGQVVVGARVEVRRPGRPTLWRRAAADGSYASASDSRVLVGLGARSAAVEARVHWPAGGVESWRGLAPGQYHRLVMGHGTPITEGPRE